MLYTQPQSGPGQIDRDAPIARGLVSSAPLAARPSDDPVDGGAWAVVASSTPVAFDAFPRGRALRIKGAGPAYVSRPIPASIGTSTTQAITLRFRVHFRVVSVISGVMSWATSAGDGAPRFYARATSTSHLNFYLGGGYRYSSPVVANRDYVVTHTFDGSLHSTYVNGVLIGTLMGGWGGNAASFFLGNGFDPAQGGTDFLISDFAAWNRALSPQEVVSDSQNTSEIFFDQDDEEEIFLSQQAAGTNRAITPQQGATALSVYAPGVLRTGHRTLVPSARALAISRYAPTITQSSATGIAPSPRALTLIGHAPTVFRAAPNAIAPGVRPMALAGYAPSIAQRITTNIEPAARALAPSGRVPTVARTAHATIQPNQKALTITGSSPTVNRSARVTVAPGQRALATTGYAPSVVRAAPGAAVFPPPSLVAAGLVYGPTGVEFTGTYTGSGLTEGQGAMLAALAAIHGLVPGTPLVVTQTTRSAGTVSQTITENGGTVTIMRA